MHSCNALDSAIEISEKEFEIIIDFLKLINQRISFSFVGKYNSKDLNNSQIIFEYKINISSLQFAPFIYIYDKSLIVLKEVNRMKSYTEFILNQEQWEYIIDSFIHIYCNQNINVSLLESFSGIFYLKKCYTSIKAKVIISRINWSRIVNQGTNQDFLQQIHSDFKEFFNRS